RIRGSSIEGLRALVKACGLDSEKVQADHVGFSLAPRLNACGRLGHGAEAVELVTTGHGDGGRWRSRRLPAPGQGH
ncbi:MAG TPA: hypothetical protein DHV85_03360, partial [Candidatus Accumulibacter sp.]|nr:hypothetical protein [Accumulibacter sp.]